jgi:hypothetical protein
VAALRSAYTRKGYSASVAEKMACSSRDSSGAVYDGKWKHYTGWCNAQGIDPFLPTGPGLAHFFDHLFEEGLAYSTLRGYKASIWSVLTAIAPVPPGVEKAISSLEKETG